LYLSDNQRCSSHEFIKQNMQENFCLLFEFIDMIIIRLNSAKKIKSDSVPDYPLHILQNYRSEQYPKSVHIIFPKK